MRAGLAGCFDIGYSYGVTDRVFQPGKLGASIDISMVGIDNPFGRGVTLELPPELIEDWRREASRQLDRPELEPGWDEDWTDLPKEAFDAVVRGVLARCPVVCRVTLYAIGIGYLRFELQQTMAPRVVEGVLTCFEYAAYKPAIATAILARSREYVDACLSGKHDQFRYLTGRPDAKLKTDDKGYQEISVFTAFTGIVRFIGEETDDDRALLRELIIGADAEQIPFEYHGTLAYTWAFCMVTPRARPEQPIDEEMARIEECFRIAHLSVAACEAFLLMFEDEISKQVESLIVGARGGRGAEALNKLRALALAVVSMTNLARVTQSEEDRSYFDKFTTSAGLDSIQQRLTNSVEVLFSVQGAKAQHDQVRRESLLNGVVVLLASLTLVSVSVDAYGFLGGGSPLVDDRVRRVQLLIEFVLGLTIVVTLLLWLVIRRPRSSS
jgi:hypothetical protein